MNHRNENDDTRKMSPIEVRVMGGELPAGSRAGAYVIDRFIARGGWGSVYQARHVATDQRVAVKVLHQSLAGSPKMVERFSREVEVVTALQHPNIVEIHEVGALADGRPFYAMEYLEGQTVHEILVSRGRVPIEEALELVASVCDALGAAHARGVVHRDVKARNIHVLSGEPRRVKLLDFGIAKLMAPAEGRGGLTTDGRQLGTMSIMAPEQFLGGPLDLRIDIYALGVLLYRLLTGTFPFASGNAADLARLHMEQPAPRPSERAPIPPQVDVIVLRCLEKRPEHRYASVAELMAALRRAMTPVRSIPPSPLATRTRAVGVHVALHTPADLHTLDDAISADIAAVLDRAEEVLVTAGFTLAAALGMVVLGVRPLPATPTQAMRAQEEVLRLATSLHEEIRARANADDRLQIEVCLHVADVVWSSPAHTEIVEGPMVETHLWLPRVNKFGLTVSPRFAASVDGFDTMTSGALPVRVAGPSPCA